MTTSANQAEFRLAMRRLAATVTVLTLELEGQPFGMVATAVCSLALEPPSILACINKSAFLHDEFAGCTRVGLNILAVNQQEIVRRFADPDLRACRFQGIELETVSEKVPLIAGSQAALVCSARNMVDYASHSILIGEVEETRVEPEISPLLYVDGNLAFHTNGTVRNSVCGRA